MADEEQKERNSEAVFRYMRRRDLSILGCVLFYMFGPAIYHWIESLNDIETNFSKIDTSGFYSGTELQLHRIQDEIFELRMEISSQRPFGWREVFEDLSR